MSSVRELHNKAMNLTTHALIERNRGNSERSLEFFEKALASELAAIAELDEQHGLAWSILHRSAGTLALDCRDYRQAEQIVAKALASEPHPAIVEELRDLWERINFERHLGLRGVVLQGDELQLSLAGQDIGSGIASFDDVYGRISSSTTLIYRIVERKLKRPFRKGGPPVKEIREGFRPLVSVPRVGSFAVTLKFGSPIYSTQKSVPDIAAIIEEFVDLIESVNKFRVADIQEIIPNPDYQQNFFNLVKRIAPDGERIRQVGFTSNRRGSDYPVELTVPAAEIPIPTPVGPLVPAPVEPITEPVEIRGVLRYVDARQDENYVIQIIDGRQSFKIFVPEDVMPEVMSMWNTQVIVQGIRTHSGVMLRDIRQYN